MDSLDQMTKKIREERDDLAVSDEIITSVYEDVNEFFNTNKESPWSASSDHSVVTDPLTSDTWKPSDIDHADTSTFHCGL